MSITLINSLKAMINQWPEEKCVAITQDGDGAVYQWAKTPRFNHANDEWVQRAGTMTSSLCRQHQPVYGDGEVIQFEQASDYTTAIITQKDFMDSIAAETHPVASSADIIAWRDRIVEIRQLQNDLSSELGELTRKIEAQGFAMIDPRKVRK